MDDTTIYTSAGIGGIYLLFLTREILPIIRRWIESRGGEAPLTDTMPPKVKWQLHMENRVLITEKMIEILGNTCEDLKAIARENSEKLSGVIARVDVLIRLSEREK